jgi:hypothetical protein
MKCRFIRVGLVCCFVVATQSILAGDKTTEKQSTDTADEQHFWQQEVKPFLQRYCYDCHSGEGAEADIDFGKYDSAELLSAERPRWNQIRGMIEIGAMPPVDYEPLPSIESREKIAKWIDRKVNTVDCGVVHDPGRVTVRRLNNVEYDNTLRDLFAIEFSPSTLVGFPSDGVGNGFDNQGDVLTLSPLQLEKYLQAARLVCKKIIVHDRESLRNQEQDIGALYATDSGSVDFLFADGVYEVKARLNFEDDKDKQKVPVALLVDGREVERWQVGNKRETFTSKQEFAAGRHTLTLQFVEDPFSKRKEYRRRIETDSIKITGPEKGEPALPESHQRLFTSYPSKKKSVEQAAREIFEPLIFRAFRRVPEPIEVERIVNLVCMAEAQGERFEDAVGLGLQAVLVSPKFLFRTESLPNQAPSQEIETLGDFALASRLSYFLWASTPDEELLALAKQGKLAETNTLKAQARRMLTDPRSHALVERFFTQYLGLGNLKTVDPDPKRFPLWNDRLRVAMQREAELFCQEIIDRDLSLATLLSADFTYVNPRLAELYGIDFDGQDPKQLYFDGPGLKRSSGSERDGLYRDEERWVRVSLPPHRQGIFTQAAVLTLTSNPTSTSPVKRGKWILESILGDPPPPAPPNVPGFEETKKEHANLSLREQLEIHRANPSCASCHRVMDPLGLGFENFDAIGQWRERDGKHPIDAAGELADGRKFNGSTQLVQLLQSRQPEISRHFAEKLLTYALGRGLEPSDNCAIDDLIDSSPEFRLSAVVEAIVTSDPFRKRSAQDAVLAGSQNQ